MSLSDWQNELVAAAIEIMESKPGDSSERGAAAIRLADGQVLTSQSPPFMNSGVSVCHETGSILRAWDLAVPISASVCVYRETPSEPVLVLAPCGICQERLRLWGPEVQVAVASDDPEGWTFVSLSELQPYYWAASFES